MQPTRLRLTKLTKGIGLRAAGDLLARPPRSARPSLWTTTTLWARLGVLLLVVTPLAACGGSNGWHPAVTAAESAEAPAGYSAPAPQAGFDRAEQVGDADGHLTPAAPPPPPAPSPGEPAPAVGADEAHAGPPSTTADDAEPGATRRPLLIYTATLTLAVFEAEASLEEVERLTLAAEGYLVRRTNDLIVVRVPAEKFREILELFAKTGDELSRDVQALDVTEQYRDLVIRLRNAEALRNRLEKLLEDAKNVEEALAVEAQLQRVAGEIELYKGKLKRLNELITFSTITIRYEALPVDQVNSEFNLPFPWLGRLGLPNLLNLEER